MVSPFFKTFKYILLCLFVTFLLACCVGLFMIPQSSKEECHCPVSHTLTTTFDTPHLLGVVVPFRDRFEELLEFAPHLVKFLSDQRINFNIYVMNQVDQYRFNRASLINVGFKIAVSDGCDYIAMHDVDLLPLNHNLSYQYPSVGLFHVASPEYHPRYHYNSFVGGILIIKKEDFFLVNGMSNKYWGWGLEDDEFFVRLKEVGLNVSRPTNLTTGIENTFRHVHDRVRRKRDMAKCFNQKEVTRHRDRQTGLRDVAFAVRSKHRLTVDTATVTVVNTELRCNRTVTPWCLCSEEKKKETSDRSQKKGR